MCFGRAEGRAREREITLLKSVALPAEDLFAAHRVYESALRAEGGL